jgi:chlorite dismutase
MSSNTDAPQAQPLFVQYMTFKADPAWRRLPLSARNDGREALALAIEEAAPEIATYAYSTVGLKIGTDMLLWRKCSSPLALQEMTSRILQTGMGTYLEPTNSLFGYTRPSTYTRRPSTQEQAIDLEDRQTYLIVYPFSKTTEWYLMSREARQGMMNEHMRIGHEYEDVRQVLLYSTGLDDQEFIVAYETEDLPRFQSLVIDLRSTEARRYTLRDTPIFTAIHRPLREALSLIG